MIYTLAFKFCSSSSLFELLWVLYTAFNRFYYSNEVIQIYINLFKENFTHLLKFLTF